MAAKKKNGKVDFTTQVLLDIRDEMRNMGLEQRATNERLDRLTQHVDHLEGRQREDAIRLATELVAVAKAVGEVRDLLRAWHLYHERVDDPERRLAALEKKSA